MITMSLTEASKILNIPSIEANVDFTGISTDTRTINKGNLFFAIKGDTFDGHDFIQDAVSKGAAAIVVSKPMHSNCPQLLVKDTILALGQMTSTWRNQFNIPMIGVTGSNGKTTLKNMIGSICKANCHNNQDEVLLTQGNLNNNIGLPLNLARLNKNHRYAVLEMGMNHFGEIAYLTELTKPTIAVINNAGEAHLEGLENVAGVARAKGEIFLGLAKNGIAVLNREDAFFDYWTSLVKDRTLISFGLDAKADVTAKIKKSGLTEIITPKGSFTLQLPLLGKHNVRNALAATAVAIAANINLDAIKTGLQNVKPAPGRMQKYQLPNQLTVIDDTYNANPLSLQAAINTLSALTGNKILVLGDMKELGLDAKNLHFIAGQKAHASGIDYLFTFGDLSAAASESFGAKAQHFIEKEALLKALQNYLLPGTTILVKGSRSMRMEQVIAKLLPKELLELLH